MFRRRTKRERSTNKTEAILKSLIDSLLILESDPANSRYHALLDKIYKAIRYCDSTLFVPTDTQIAEKVTELKTVLETASPEKDDRVKLLIDELLELEKARTGEVKVIRTEALHKMLETK